ncbi:hypothetical protein GUJ93_ZPchr0007g6365 [Zizania palustris]|uniref:Uncharacterized protein n=1 Tax=Zizania palustris TaxID=103762 RepID=A0A8J5TKH9_ZIZPA|nr:hypothetical protein GUJ93_ZPchr0007g6365 [Zizania palustris]
MHARFPERRSAAVRRQLAGWKSLQWLATAFEANGGAAFNTAKAGPPRQHAHGILLLFFPRRAPSAARNLLWLSTVHGARKGDQGTVFCVSVVSWKELWLPVAVRRKTKRAAMDTR